MYKTIRPFRETECEVLRSEQLEFVETWWWGRDDQKLNKSKDKPVKIINEHKSLYTCITKSWGYKVTKATKYQSSNG